MSKASQRQEAERIKRLAKKKPKAGRVLDTIFYAMPRAANEPLNVWKAVAAWGDKRRKRQDDSDVLSSVMDEAALVAETLDAVNPGPDYYAFEDEGVFPGVLLASNGKGILAWEPMSFSVTRSKDGKFGTGLEWQDMRDHAEGVWEIQPAYLVRIVRLADELEGTVMLGYATSGAMETRILCRGSWLAPKADEAVIAAVEEWIQDRETELMYRQGARTVMSKCAQLMKGLPDESRREVYGALGRSMVEAQRPYVEVSRRLHEWGVEGRAKLAKEAAEERLRRESLEDDLAAERRTTEALKRAAAAREREAQQGKAQVARSEGTRRGKSTSDTAEECAALMERLKTIF